MEVEDVLIELQDLATSLGTLDDDKCFVPKEESRDSVKRMVQLVLRDDPEGRRTHRALASWNTVEKELVPLLQAVSDDFEFCFDVAKLLAVLTMPVNMSIENVHEDMNYLFEYKSCLARREVIQTLMYLIGGPLSHEGADRTRDDNIVLELVLILFRNILAVPAPAQLASATSTVNEELHGVMVARFEEEGFLDTISQLAQNISEEENRRWNMLVLEILSLIFRGASPDDVFAASLRNETDRSAPVVASTGLSLAEMQIREKAQRQRMLSQLPTRHSRFGGVFVQTDAGDKRHIYSKQANSVMQKQAIITSTYVAPAPRTKKTKPIATSRPTYVSGQSKSVLKRFALQLVNEAMNPLMKNIKFDIERESSQIVAADHTHFIMLQAFVLGIHRLSEQKRISELPEDTEDSPVKDGYNARVLSECLDVASFQYALRRAQMCYDGGTTDDGKMDYKGMEAISHLLKELMSALYLVCESKDPNTAQIGTRLQQHVFYEHDQLTMFITFTKLYAPHLFSRKFMENMAETNDAILRMLESLEKRSERLIVLQKQRGGRKKKDVEAKVAEDSVSSPVQEGAERQGEEENRAEEGNKPEEQDENGSKPADREDEVVADDVEDKPKGSPKLEEEEGAVIFHEDEDKDDDDRLAQQLREENNENEEEGESRARNYSERELNYHKFLHEFASQQIVSHYVLLLQTYMKNTDNLNRAVLSFLQTIGEHCNCEPFLYQLGNLRIISTILSDTSLKSFPRFVPMYEYLTKVAYNLIVLLNDHPVLYADLLFHKSRNEAVRISFGYADAPKPVRERIAREKGLKASKSAWTEEEDAILREYYPLYKDMGSYLQQLEARLTDRSSRQIALRLGKLGLREVKRRSKTAEAEVVGTFSASDSESNQEMDDAFFDGLINKRDSDSEGGKAKTKKRPKKLRKSSASDQKPSSEGESSEYPDAREPANVYLQQIKERDMQLAVDWLAQQFEDALERVEGGGASGTNYPILPHQQAQWDWISMPEFQKLMLSLSIRPPTESQSQYWNILGLPSSELRRRLDFLKEAENAEGVFPSHRTIMAASSTGNSRKQKSSVQKLKAGKQIRKKKSVPKPKASSDADSLHGGTSSEEEKTEETVVEQKKLLVKRKRLQKRNQSASEESDNSEPQREETAAVVESAPAKKKRVVDSDEDVEEEVDLSENKGARRTVRDESEEERVDDSVQLEEGGESLSSKEQQDAPRREKRKLVDSEDEEQME